MTGIMPSTTGLYDNGHWWYPNMPGVVTIPRQFSLRGYRVVGSGKIFHHTAGNHPPNQWDDFLPIRFRADRWFRDSKLNYPWTDALPFPEGFPYANVSDLPHENDWGTLPIRDADYDDALSVDYAVRFLKEQAQEGPFFLACGLFRPHLPWYVPHRFFDLYPLETVALPPIKEHDLDDVPREGRALAEARQSDFLPIRQAGKWRHAIQAYLASISYADAQLGRVIRALKTSGVEENTIIVLWSDHGWHLGEKGHWHKSTLWEAATRVPLVVVAPGFAKGQCRVPVSLVDLFPTLNELCGFKPDERHDGQSLVPLLRDPAAALDRVAVTEFRKGNATVRSQRYRYTRYADGGEELYDHQADPNEWDNLMGSHRARTIADRLGAQLPRTWAASAPTKKAFDFDPSNFVWTDKLSGRQIRGDR